jgi:formylglycine-generating enzyme required for sulfatase activity
MEDDSLPRFATIPAGDFLMGSNEGEPDERPVHPVYLDAFQIAIHPVTVDQYARFVRETGHAPLTLDTLPRVVSPRRRQMFRELALPYVWQEGQPPQGFGRHPVTLVQFDGALAYCRWLALTTGKRCRLPTEAEWERAARGGLVGKRYPWGDEIDQLHANFLPDVSAKARRGTQPTGTYRANGFGLFDMAGNVWQWVSDWYDSEYYASSPPRNPQGPASGRLRIVRGGSWVNEDVRYLRCACRHKVPPDTYTYSIGFRVASSLP